MHGKMHGLIGTGVRGNCIIFISWLITKQVLQLILFILSRAGAIKRMIWKMIISKGENGHWLECLLLKRFCFCFCFLCFAMIAVTLHNIVIYIRVMQITRHLGIYKTQYHSIKLTGLAVKHIINGIWILNSHQDDEGIFVFLEM